MWEEMSENRGLSLRLTLLLKLDKEDQPGGEHTNEGWCGKFRQQLFETVCPKCRNVL